jgi:alkyl sulfatase BDS1-like metallo-beta-lactamase superfamily hydrolase
MKFIRTSVLALVPLLSMAAFGSAFDERKPATAATIEAQRHVLAALPPEDGRDEKWARQGFIATLDDPVSRRADGGITYDPESTKFVDAKEAPPTVNPSLWRHQRLLRIHGLFQVSKNIYQVRGLSCTNTTFIRGKTGWVVIDPDMTTETATSVRKLLDTHFGKRPISAIVYSHSHIDHFGGVKGMLGDQTEELPIVAPEGLVEEAGSEWVMVGNVMTRRSHFQWGMELPRDPQGFIGTGLSSEVPIGSLRFLPPTDFVSKTGETRTLDGVKLEFQMVPDTEAPSEMNIYVPDERVLFIAEFATATMHNLQTPRGAKARDARAWAGYLTETLDLYGDRSDAVIFGHTWPRFGTDAIKSFLRLQRDNYKFIHDQTLRMANLGMTADEIANTLTPPKGISDEWSTHGYYGNYKHNVRGVYQYYIGWWDGIPAHLDPLPQIERAKGYVDLAGGAQNALAQAKKAFDQGNYRWSAEIANHVVFADPDNRAARELLADSYEQLGYQSESANFRNIYLVSAAELRGKPPYKHWLGSPDLINSMSTASFMDLLATRLNPQKVAGQSMTLVFDITDTKETVRVDIENGVLVAHVGASAAQSDVRLTGARNVLMGFFLQRAPLDKMKAAGLKLEGNETKLLALQSALEPPRIDFAVVTP